MTIWECAQRKEGFLEEEASELCDKKFSDLAEETTPGFLGHRAPRLLVFPQRLTFQETLRSQADRHARSPDVQDFANGEHYLLPSGPVVDSSLWLP